VPGRGRIEPVRQNPTFTVYAGPMFSTKTSRLLLDIERAKHQKKRVVVFKPALDDRYSTVEVTSHMGWSYPAKMVRDAADVLQALTDEPSPPDVVAVDEAFMVRGIAEVLIWLFRSGISVVAATLDLSFSGKPFPEVERMLPWATRVEKCASVCVVCGCDAYYTHKKHVSGEEIEVGGPELYEPRCFSHHIAIDNRPEIHEG
jgi:thymidine kinase